MNADSKRDPCDSFRDGREPVDQIRIRLPRYCGARRSSNGCEPVGDNARKGAVKKRNQTKTKRDTMSGEFMAIRDTKIKASEPGTTFGLTT
jgi:hypothetical protein